MTEPTGDLSASGVPKVQQINKAVDRILSASTTTDDPNHTSISETDLLKLSQFLRASERSKWAERPRIYAILHLIGQPEAIEEFVKEDIFDISLPFRENRLPFALKAPSARKAFIQLQSRVLTSAADIEKKPGTHQSLRNGDLYYQTKSDLGSGSFGWVDQVWSTLSFEFFARKRILRRATFRQDHEAITAFINELKVLQKISHHHLVEVVGSYTDIKHVALLMRPVAKTDLKEYLRLTPFPQENYHQLRKFFGCLAVGVRYLHRQNIRHKDIKPSNILISHTGDILITDFGTSLDWTENGRSTTHGSKLVGLTPEYCAPEVFSYEDRNTLSDIYSLGCVYFEMLTLLKGETIQSLHQFFSGNGMKLMSIRTNLTVANFWLDQLLLKPGNGYDNTPVTWIRRMIENNQDRRPSSEELAQWTIGIDNASRFCCPSCMDEDEVHSQDDPPLSDVDESSLAPEASKNQSFSQELMPDMDMDWVPDGVKGPVEPDTTAPASSNQDLPSNLPSAKSNPKQQQQGTPNPSSPYVSSSNMQRSPQNTVRASTPGPQLSQKTQPDPQLIVSQNISRIRDRDRERGPRALGQQVSARMDEYFVPGDGIDREVITADIAQYLGNDALVRPGSYENPQTGQVVQDYFIPAYRNLTTALIADLKADSERWEAERRISRGQHFNEYWDSTTHRGRQYYETTEGIIAINPGYPRTPGYAVQDNYYISGSDLRPGHDPSGPALPQRTANPRTGAIRSVATPAYQPESREAYYSAQTPQVSYAQSPPLDSNYGRGYDNRVYRDPAAYTSQPPLSSSTTATTRSPRRSRDRVPNDIDDGF